MRIRHRAAAVFGEGLGQMCHCGDRRGKVARVSFVAVSQKTCLSNERQWCLGTGHAGRSGTIRAADPSCDSGPSIPLPGPAGRTNTHDQPDQPLIPPLGAYAAALHFDTPPFVFVAIILSSTSRLIPH